MKQNSLEAYKEVQKTLTDKQAKVLSVFQKVKEASNKEISAMLGWAINSVTPRTGELLDLGYITHSHDKKIDGRNHAVNKITELGMALDLEPYRGEALKTKEDIEYEALKKYFDWVKSRYPTSENMIKAIRGTLQAYSKENL